jgi:ABC-2 type transport system permease protein
MSMSAPHPAASFPRQFGNEMIKLFARPRTHIGFVIFFSFEILLLALLQLPRPRRSFRNLLESNGYLFAEYFSGLTLATLIVATSIFFLGVLFLALVAGDIVAKEVEDGTMRMILNRPVPRLQVLLAKWFACLAYTLVFILFVGLSALLAGLAYRGWGGLFAYFPTQEVFAVYSPGPGLARYALAVIWLALVMSVASSIAFLFSCLPMKPAAASILTLAFFFADFVMNNLPYFADYKYFFLTHHMGTWAQVFRPVIPWPALLESLLWLWAVSLTCFALAAIFFSQRDFKS